MGVYNDKKTQKNWNVPESSIIRRKISGTFKKCKKIHKINENCDNIIKKVRVGQKVMIRNEIKYGKWKMCKRKMVK